MPDDDRMQLDDYEFDSRLLEAGGATIPESWDGRPVRLRVPLEEGMPLDGWREIVTRTDATGVTTSVVLAAPVAATDQWWTLYLQGTADGWDALPAFDPVRLRPCRAVRRARLQLTWPSTLITVSRAQLHDLTVVLSSRDGGPWEWDVEDRAWVLGWMTQPETDERLPYDPWQAVTGFGPAVEQDSRGRAVLPVRLITEGLGQLALGWYGVVATLAALNLDSEVGSIELIA